MLTRTISKWGLAALSAALLVLLPILQRPCAAAESWPNRPVRFIVTLGAGSGVDIGARLFADKLSALWGQPVVVENRPGGDGMVAITAFLAAHDDHVLLVTPVSSFTAHPYFHDKLPYDPKDLVPIARISNTVIALSVPTALKINSVKELVALAKAKPGQLNWTTATGSTDFVFAGFLHDVGLTMAKVPYKNPVSAVNDLAEGRIQVYMPAYAIVRPQVAAGKVKVLAVTDKSRAAPIPEVPTTAEAGLPGLVSIGWFAMAGPPRMKPELADLISRAANDVLKMDDVQAKFRAVGVEPIGGAPAAMAAFVKEESARWGDVIRKNNIVLD